MPENKQNVSFTEREHTATTSLIVEVTVTVPGDEGVDPDYLTDVLMWGLEQHNLAVARIAEDTNLNEDHVIQPLHMSATETLGDLEEPEFIFLVGNLSDGFQPYGPYPDVSEAAGAHEFVEGWLMELTPPRNTDG